MGNTEQPKPAASAAPASNESGELTRLREENKRLRVELAKAKGTGVDAPEAGKPASFGMSEGTRVDLEVNGKTTDPFTGEELTRDDLK